MKTRYIFAGICFIILLSFMPVDAYCQGKAGGPPPWAPAHGYRAKTRHIYFPDHNFYYDTRQGTYIYLQNGGWTVAAKLPSLFSNVNLRSAVQIELDLSGDHPQRHNKEHLVKYKAKAPKQGKPGKGNNGHGHKKGNGRH